MKKVLASAIAFGMLAWAGSAMALPALDPGFAWNDSDYWTITDLTTGVEGNSLFMLTMENASYESSFGLYTVDSVASPTAVTSSFQVFAAGDEPTTLAAVYFQEGCGSWQVSLDQTSWQAFDDTFGFYFGVANTGDTWYSDIAFNADGEEHVAIAYSTGLTAANIYLDDQYGGGDRDFNDMKVFGDDLAPVPEPATMLLFGSGLVGLAGVRRRKKAAKE
ncbi:MAG: PEP-CTERM sorting domain-containing protein [Thermodesulfobacteriota bacterium]